MINYGIVGTGYFGADLARSINKIEDAEIIEKIINGTTIV